MTKTNFNAAIDRKGTFCTQWDYIEDRFGEAELLPFTVSDMDVLVAPAIMTALNQRMQHQLFGYTRWNHAYYKEAITNWYHQRYQTTIEPDWLVYSPAVIFSVAKLIEMWSQPGEGVLIQTPAYDAFFKVIEANGRHVVDNRLRYQDGKYTIDFADLEAKLSLPTTRVLLLCSPHNPTGRVWTTAELSAIITLCERYHVKIISDEIHMDISRDGIAVHPLVQQQRYLQHIAICTSASKTFNTPGLIGSYCVIPSNLERERFLYSLKNKNGLSSTSILGMISTVAGYEEGGEWLDELNVHVTSNLTLIKDFLAAELPAIRFTIPEATYLAWLDVSGLNVSAAALQHALITVAKVAIMPGATYDPHNDQFIRFNVGCSRAKLVAGLQRLKRAVAFLEKDS